MEEVFCATVAEWHAWLVEHHADHKGVWLRMLKKGTGEPSVTYPEALDEALCHGWIDGQKKSGDERSYLQKFTPRGARSLWSKINREKVARLESEGRMKPAGRRHVEAAQADGRWEAAYDSPKNATVPDDLTAALAERPQAKAFFEGLSATNRYSILWRLQTAKKPETRARRMATVLDMLERGETFH